MESNILSQKSDSNHYFGEDSTIILEWVNLNSKTQKTDS